MKFALECLYCAFKWVKTAYSEESFKDEKCPHGNCKHKRFRVTPLNSSKIDYYAGSPPFPIELEKEIRGWTI